MAQIIAEEKSIIDQRARALAWLRHTNEIYKSIFGPTWMNKDFTLRDYDDGRGLVYA